MASTQSWDQFVASEQAKVQVELGVIERMMGEWIFGHLGQYVVLWGEEYRFFDTEREAAEAKHPDTGAYGYVAEVSREPEVSHIPSVLYVEGLGAE